jgi:predicted MFS family arabinose efflux permease
MSEKSERTRNFLIMLTLGLSAMAVMNEMVIVPVAGNLFHDFAGSNIAALNYILSGPRVVGALCSLLCAKLMFVISKRKLMIIGFAIFAVSSILGDVIHNPYYMVVMRSLTGAGMGITSVVALAIISGIFVDEKTRGSMMGIYNALMTIVGAVLGWVSGLVGAVEWRMVYRVYLAAVPILAMIVIFIPNDRVPAGEGAIKTIASGGEKTPKIPWRSILFMEAAFIIYTIGYFVVFLQISMIVAAKGLGGVSLSGIFSALGTVGSMMLSASFGLYHNKLKRFTICIGFALMALSYWMLWTATSVPAALIANTLLGASYGLGVSYYMMYCTVIVPPVQIPLSISITATILNIGAFLSTYCGTLLQKIMGAATIVDVLPVLIVILTTGAIVSLVFSIVKRKKRCHWRRKTTK